MEKVNDLKYIIIVNYINTICLNTNDINYLICII